MYGKNFFVYGLREQPVKFQQHCFQLLATTSSRGVGTGEIAYLFCGTVPGNKIRTPQRSRWRPRVPTRDAKEENGRRPDLLGKKTLARLAAKGSVRFTVCTAVTLRQVCSFQFSDNSESEWIHPCVKKSADIARNLPDIDNMRIKMKPAAVKVAKGKSDYINLKPEFVCIVPIQLEVFSSRKNLVGWCRNMSRMVSVSFSI